MELSVIYFKGSRFAISKFAVFLSLKIGFTLKTVKTPMRFSILLVSSNRADSCLVGTSITKGCVVYYYSVVMHGL